MLFLRKNKITDICVVLILAILLFCLSQGEDNEDNFDKNYLLIYDKAYYLEHNPDVRKLIGEDDKDVFRHFITYGMKEGRRASKDFDVYYYRDNNGDLGAEYGENLVNYYMHYMKYGYQEGRKGSDNYSEKYECNIVAEIVEGTNEVKLNINVLNEMIFGETFFVFSVPAYSDQIEKLKPVFEGTLEKNIAVYHEMENLNNKYVIAEKENNEYKLISNFAYVENPEVLSTNGVALPVPRTKKGLQIANSMLEDVEQLNPSYVFMNLVIETIMYPGKVEKNVIQYEYKNRTYYFKEDMIQEYDHVISSLTNLNMLVNASIISIKSAGFSELYYPGISMDTGATYYALNTTNEAGTNYVEAFVNFMSERYNGTNSNRGVIVNWIVGNEVNESGTYNYMGKKGIEEYLDEYTRTFRIVYNIVKRNIPDAGVYMPMEPWWGIDSNLLTYGGKEFLDKFNNKIKKEGNIEWGLAYHAYSFPLSDPKVLNDVERTIDENGELTLEGYVTTDSIRSVTISMENIEVLTEYMHNYDFLTADGKVRSIILSEQGYTANSNLYGKCEAQQASSMVYSYYKAQMNQDIDAFIYFLQKDTQAASLNNQYYQFGLWGELEDGTLEKRMSHEIFRVMDTKESLDILEYMKVILGIENWENVIPDFKIDVFDGFPSVNSLVTIENERVNGKYNIENAEICIEEVVSYTGMECLPNVSVKFEGRLLKNDVDYDVVYLKNIKPGNASVVIVGLGQYIGVKEATFFIVE